MPHSELESRERRLTGKTIKLMHAKRTKDIKKNTYFTHTVIKFLTKLEMFS